jgi:hypothetical protein
LSRRAHFGTRLGSTVIIANPRQPHAIACRERKRDRRNAAMLSRQARVNAALHHPLQYGPALAKLDLLDRELRYALVRTRVSPFSETPGSRHGPLATVSRACSVILSCLAKGSAND